MKFLHVSKMALVLSAVLLVAAACDIGGQPPSQTAGAAQQPTTTTPIQHLVVIYQENNSFDHYFGTYPNALNPAGEPAFTAAANTPAVNGLTDDLLHHNPNLANPQRLDRSQLILCDQDHDYIAEQQTFDNGRMDKFVQKGAAGCTNKAVVMDYYDGNTITALWNYAQHYALSDSFFQTTFGPSALGAINLVSGQTHGATPANVPGLVIQGTVIADIRPVYDDCSKGQMISMSGKNVGDLLNAKNVTWGWFAGGFTPTSTNGGVATCNSVHTNLGGVKQADYIPHHEPFQFYQSTANPHHVPPSSSALIGKNDQAHHQYDLTDFWTAVDAGNMPAVSFIKPMSYQDGHVNYSDPLDEQQFLVDTLNRLQKSPTWKNTAVIITYDDSDGWYDHVSSPTVNPSNDPRYDALSGPGMCGGTVQQGAYEDRCGFGPRIPLLMISPYAKQNFVDHTVTNQASILRFIEDNWNLGNIGNQSFDQMSGSLNSMFDFATPRKDLLMLDPMNGLPTTGAAPAGASQGTTGATTSPSQTAPQAPATAQASATITTDANGNFAFSPAPLTVAAGTKVTWTNSSSVAHTVTSDDGGATFDSGAMAAGGTFSFTFTKPGSYPYHCDIHPYMKATIVVK